MCIVCRPRNSKLLSLCLQPATAAAQNHDQYTKNCRKYAFDVESKAQKTRQPQFPLRRMRRSTQTVDAVVVAFSLIQRRIAQPHGDAAEGEVNENAWSRLLYTSLCATDRHTAPAHKVETEWKLNENRDYYDSMLPNDDVRRPKRSVRSTRIECNSSDVCAVYVLSTNLLLACCALLLVIVVTLSKEDADFRSRVPYVFLCSIQRARNVSIYLFTWERTIVFFRSSQRRSTILVKNKKTFAKSSEIRLRKLRTKLICEQKQK